MSDAVARRLNELRVQAEAYGDAARDAYRLDHLRKIVRARLMQESGASSVAAAEKYAEAHDEYVSAVEQAAEAEGRRVALKALHEVAMQAMSVWQTGKRAETEKMKYLGEVT